MEASADFTSGSGSVLGSDSNLGLVPRDVVQQSNLEPPRPLAPLFGIGDVESGDLLSGTMAHLHGGPAICPERRRENGGGCR